MIRRPLTLHGLGTPPLLRLKLACELQHLFPRLPEQLEEFLSAITHRAKESSGAAGGAFYGPHGLGETRTKTAATKNTETASGATHRFV